VCDLLLILRNAQDSHVETLAPVAYIHVMNELELTYLAGITKG
jgi:hypothetical protein